MAKARGLFLIYILCTCDSIPLIGAASKGRGARLRSSQDLRYGIYNFQFKGHRCGDDPQLEECMSLWQRAEQAKWSKSQIFLPKGQSDHEFLAFRLKTYNPGLLPCLVSQLVP